MGISTMLTRKLKISHPIIQAPMAGGGDTPELVTAVSNAGGLGFIGAAYLTPAQIIEVSRAIRNITNRSFGINLFAPSAFDSGTSSSWDLQCKHISHYYAELNLPEPVLPSNITNSFYEQLAASVESGASAFSFTFGIIPPDAVALVKSRGMLLLGTATTVKEAIAIEKAGADAVIAQGSEAGGHRGSFLEDFEASMIGTMALVPQITDAVKIPAVASGGIMDGRGIAAALTLGASAVQMGTAFLTTSEAGIPEVYKEAIMKAAEDQTKVTRAFSGRPARGIINRFMQEMDASASEVPIPPFPVQNFLTRPLRTAAAKQQKAEFLSLWAGQALRLARRQPAGELVLRLANETEEAISKLRTIIT